MIFPLLPAQLDAQSAASVINQSLELSTGIVDSWNQVWDDLLNSSDPLSLWSAIVKLSATAAAFSLIYLILRSGNEIAKNQYLGAIIEMFLFPLTVALLLSNNGRLLADLIRIVRGVGENAIRSVGEIQLSGIQLNRAIQQFQLNNLSVERIRQLYNECQGLAGADLNQCFESKRQIAEGIIQAFSGQPVDIGPAQAFLQHLLDYTIIGFGENVGDFIQGGFTQVLQDRLYPFVQFMLFAVQWAFLNAVEAALFLTAAFAPIAVALSLLPIAGRPIWAWGSGFLSLLGLKLGYTILVGIVAVVMVNVEGDFAEVAASSGFLMFIAVFAPMLAVSISTFGGVALYQGISSRANQITSTVAHGVSTVVMYAVPMKK